MDVSDDVLNVVIDHQKCLQSVEVYRGLQRGNVRLVQFTPLVEHDGSGHLIGGSVTSETWGRFLITIFDIWVREDIDQIPTQLSDKILHQWCGLTAQIGRQTMSPMGARCQICLLFQYHYGDRFAYCEGNGKGVLYTGHQTFFNHVAPYMRVTRDLLKQHHSPMELMAMLR